MGKEPCTKFCSVLIKFQEVIKLEIFEFSISDVIPGNVQNISSLVFFAFFVRIIEKKPIKFYGVFVQFWWTYEVAKFWIIKLYLDVHDIIHMNKHTKYASCDVPVRFWIFLLMSFCFMMKKDHFKQKLFLWLQVNFFSSLSSIVL